MVDSAAVAPLAVEQVGSFDYELTNYELRIMNKKTIILIAILGVLAIAVIWVLVDTIQS